MPPPSRKLIIRAHAVPYWMTVSAPSDKEFFDRMKYWPGVRWEANNKVYAVPKELEACIREVALDFDLELDDLRKEVEWPKAGVNPNARKYQVQPILRGLRDRALFINFEMGLGKTFAAIEILRLAACRNILIISPANVRLVWQDELEKHWPTHPPINIIDSQAVEFQKGQINVTSYELFLKRPYPWPDELEGIVLDEAHHIKNSTSNRGLAVQQLLYKHAYKHIIKIALTGTPICDQPIDLWHQLECFWPDRFGDFFEFREAYCSKRENIHASSGYEYFGVNEARAPELFERIAGVASRMTREQVKDQLPAFDITTHRIRGKRHEIDFKLFEKMDGDDLEAALGRIGDEKMTTAVELALNDSAQTSHVCVLTHRKSVAERIAQELQEESNVPVVLVHGGNTTPKTRHAALARARAFQRCFLVATMDSIQEGVDLTRFTVATYAELHYKSKVMRQSLLRFSRLNSKSSSMCRFLVLEGSIDEVIASALMRKTEAQGKVVAAGQAESGLKSALEVQMSDDDFFEQLRHAAATKLENKHGY